MTTEYDPIVRILREAAQRGREIRLTREKYDVTTEEAVKILDGHYCVENGKIKIRIYRLRDPITQEIRYIGQTSGPLEECLSQHLYDKSRNARTNWIRGLRKIKRKPLIEEIVKIDRSDGNEREQYWISFYRDEGFDLLNDQSAPCDKQ